MSATETLDAVLIYHDHLRLMLGATKNQRKTIHGYRNHFCAEIESQHWIEMESMVELGLVVRGATINQGRDRYYHATRGGCHAINLSRAAIKRAGCS